MRVFGQVSKFLKMFVCFKQCFRTENIVQVIILLLLLLIQYILPEMGGGRVPNTSLKVPTKIMIYLGSPQTLATRLRGYAVTSMVLYK